MSEFTAIDHLMMTRALRLAANGNFTTRPNPRVGCVLAHNEVVVGQGFHLRKGEPHAEVHALAQAGGRAKGATAYVTLEPCAHFGRTPPCANALIDAQVARVVCAIEDPFEKVAGKGFEALRNAGIEVKIGLMRDAAFELNRGFFTRINLTRPWIRIKTAASLDGRTALASGASKWITGESARHDVARWRAQSCAILTGIETVLSDDPELTVRNIADAFIPPLRVVLDTHLRIPLDAKILHDIAPTMVICSAQVDALKRAALVARGVVVSTAPLDEKNRIALHFVMDILAKQMINEVQVEAGSLLCGALLQANWVDEWLHYMAPIVLGETDDKGNTNRGLFQMSGINEMAARKAFRVVDSRMLGVDQRLLMRKIE